MKMVRGGRFLQAFLSKWRKLSREVMVACTSMYGHDHYGTLLGNKHEAQEEEEEEEEEEEGIIPKDVPKGHMVVYVGEHLRRFVIRVAFLHHPLFQPLLDRAREEYQFNPDSKLCIPCDEAIFLTVLCYVSSLNHPRTWL